MKVEYDQLKSDILWFWRHHLFTAPYLRRLSVAAIGAAVVLNGVVTYVRWMNRTGQLRATAIAAATTLPIMLLAGAVLLPIFGWCGAQLLLREGRAKGVLGRHVVTLNQDGVQEETQYGQQSATWLGLYRVEVVRDFLLIYVQPAMAHVVPRRAFASDVDFRAFASRAVDLWTAAKSDRV